MTRSRLFGPVAFALLGLAAPVSSLADEPPAPRRRMAPASPVDKLIDEGSRKLQAGDPDGAIALFKQAEPLAPKDPRPRFLRGEALAAKNDVDGAIAAYREALALDGKQAAVRAELGALLLDAGKIEEGAKEIREALLVDHGLAQAWWNLAKAESRLKNGSASIDAFRRAMKLLPKDADLRVDASMELRRAGGFDEAVAIAREAVSLDPKSEPAQMALGFALQSAGKLDDAAGAFTAATRLQPKDARAFWALGNCEIDRKRFADAITALSTARTLKPQPAIGADLARALGLAGRCADAEKELAALPPKTQEAERARFQKEQLCPPAGKPAATPAPAAPKKPAGTKKAK